MKILSYNGRGFQKTTAVTALVKIQKRQDADVIFLMETHLDDWPAECLRKRLHTDHKEVVRSDGRKGGLLLMWKKEVIISLRFKTDNFIDVFIGTGQDHIWRFTGFYGESKWSDKYKSWDRLRELRTVSSMPWVVMGDMNEILYPFEKEGGRARPSQYLQAFQDTLTECGLSDLGFIGDKYTWHRAGIRERLDRVVACDNWRSKFSNAVVQNLDYERSDHRPILLSFGLTTTNEVRSTSVLRFEARWLRERNFHEIVDNAWATGYQAQTEGLAGRLAFMHDILHQWDRSVLKKPQNKIKQVKREFEEITRAELNEENLRREKELAVELEKLLKQEEVYWAQRSRINWLKFGDQNTGFFTILHLGAEQGME
jgi:hypothetical protein